MISFKDYLEEKKKDPCWTGYEAIGMKEKNGKKVPNCVPVKESCLCPHDPHGDYKAKSKALHDLSLNKDVDQKAVQQRKLDLDKEYEKVKKEEFELAEAATADAKGHKSATGGLTQKGRDAYNREHGSNLKAPVTTPPSKLKAGSKAANRRKSFCARMSGVDGPMKKPNGEPTRKALALRKWNC
jgi:hypothetical protein